MKPFRPIWAFVFLIAGIIPAFSETPTIRDLIGLKYPSELALSPDGRFVAFTVRETDFRKSRYFRNIWRVSTRTGHIQKLTFGTDQNRSPRFSPDGNVIAFLSNRSYVKNGRLISNRTQIWILPERGDPWRLTNGTENVQFFRWAPDGNSIAFIVKKALPDSVRRIRKEQRSRGFDAKVVGKIGRPNEIWRVVLSDRTTQKLATVDPGLNYLAFSPDGKTLAFTTNYTGSENDAQKYDIFLLNIRSKTVRPLTEFPGPETSPVFSPDGKFVAYLSQTVPDIEFAQTDVSLITVKGGAPKNLTANFDYAVTNFKWDPRGKRIYFDGAIRTASNIFSVNVSSGEINGLLTGTNCFSDFQISANGKYWAYLTEDSRSLPELTYFNGKKTFRLSDFSDQLKPFPLGDQRVIQWKSDNWTIEGLLVTPVGYQPGKPVPLIVAIHGGPYGRFQDRFRQYYQFQLWSNHGYAVLAPNPRGSEGYGDKFGQANRYDLGGGDYRDIMRGVDHVIQMGVADSTRMGVIGGSYGGYMTNWIISQTQRFKAAVSMYGIFSLLTDWSNSVQPSWEKMYFGNYYWEDLQPYLKRSPAFYVTNIQTPVLILHGEDDQMTFISNSKEMYQALHVLKRPVKFVVYPREGHGISREPNHRVDVCRRALKWFDRYLNP